MTRELKSYQLPKADAWGALIIWCLLQKTGSTLGALPRGGSRVTVWGLLLRGLSNTWHSCIPNSEHSHGPVFQAVSEREGAY